MLELICLGGFMRVISGSKRGQKLIAPEGISTRPTEDRIKENIFNLIGPMYVDTYGLDLFSGSGQMGIELLSRGCSYCVFVDNSKSAATTIKENLKKTGLLECSKIIGRDVFNALDEISKMKLKFQYIYMDPPFSIELDIYTRVLEQLHSRDLLEDDALIIIESSEEYVVPEEFSIYKERQYRDILIRMLKRDI